MKNRTDTERAAAKAKADFLLILLSEMKPGFPVEAKWLYNFMECKMPFGLWCYWEISSQYAEREDWLRVSLARPSILSTSDCGVGTQTTSLPACPTSG